MRFAPLVTSSLALLALQTAHAAPPRTATKVTATTVTAAPVPVVAPLPAPAPVPSAIPAAGPSPVANTFAAPEPAPAAAQSQPLRAPSKRGLSLESLSVEDPTQTYYTLGPRYRGILLPGFVTGLFSRQAQSQYFNNVGIELDVRRDGFSLTPSISFLGMGTDPILFADKSKPEAMERNWSRITSELKGIMLGLDMQWSTPLDRTVFLEYGLGVGLAFMFGNVGVNWVYKDASGNYISCATTTSGADRPDAPRIGEQGCNPAAHDTNNSPPRVGEYKEPSWFDGGQKPSIIPWLSMPQLGLRVNPVPEFQARVGGGLSLLGPWFGLSMSYGIPQLDALAPPRRR